MIHFFFNYNGAKYNETKKLYDVLKLDNKKTIVEPFAGSCGFSIYSYLRKNMTNYNYVLNDIDKKLIDFLTDVKAGKFPEYIKFYSDKSQKYYDDISLWRKDRADIKNKIGMEWYLIRKLSKGSMLHGYNKNDVVKIAPKVDYNKYIKHENFFKSPSVTLSNLDYLDIFEQYKDNKEAILFLDPPYFDSNNTEYVGFDDKKQSCIKDNTKMFIDILKFIDTCSCSVIMIMNENAITRYLYEKYIYCTYSHIYQFSKKKTNHMIIYKH